MPAKAVKKPKDFLIEEQAPKTRYIIEEKQPKTNYVIEEQAPNTNYIIEEQAPKTNYIIEEKQSPKTHYIIEKRAPTVIRDVASPSHIPLIEIKPPHPQLSDEPKVIKLSRNEIVSSRTPVSSTNSRAQLIRSSSDKKPVILNKNFGENLNAFT